MPQHNEDHAGDPVEIHRQIASRSRRICPIHQRVTIGTSNFGGLWPASWAASDAMVAAIAGSSMRRTRATLLVHALGNR